jgi:carnitine O-acetyltransferase
VIFVRKNKFYEVEVVQDGKELSVAELENQIRQVYEAAGDSLGTPIGALTAENRDIWADVRSLHFLPRVAHAYGFVLSGA